jgi:aryl-alcohol dehydrogenase-like predicted oxidoreductase
MNQRQLGNTTLKASEIALGTVEIGLDYGIPTDGYNRRPEEKDAARFLNEALDVGITFLDTAHAYGTSEEIIGRALKHRRNDYVLATKLAPLVTADLTNGGLRDKVRSSVEESLRKLQTDRIDMLLIHSAPMTVIQNAEELLGFMRELQQEGHVKHIGASVYEEAGPEALSRGGMECLQIAYNALDRSPEELTLPLAAKTGVGIVVRSVLLKGAITARYRDLPDQLIELKRGAEALDALAHDAGITLPELAYRYVLAQDVIALCGTARLDELKAAVDYAERGPLSPDLVSRIREIDVADRRVLNPSNWPF